MFKLLVLTSFVVSLCCFMIGTALMFAIPSVAASGPWAGVSTFVGAVGAYVFSVVFFANAVHGEGIEEMVHGSR